MTEEQDIELRSESVQEIMGHIPHWIIRWGISLIFVIIVFLLIGSYFFRYPEIIPSEIVVITENMPAAIEAKSNGKIQHLFVKNNQIVEKGHSLAVIENPASYEDMKDLKFNLDTFRKQSLLTDSVKFVRFNENYSMGDIQPVFSSFLKQYSNFMNFIEMDYYRKKIVSVEQQIVKYKSLYSRYNSQKNILQEELRLSEDQYNRDQKLFKQSVISQTELENSKSAYLQKKYSYEGALTSLASTNIQITQLEQDILDLKLKQEEEKKQSVHSLTEAYNNLKSQIDQWEQSYLLQSPIPGKVSLTTFWSINQNVKAGDVVLTIVPTLPSKIIGKVQLPIQGSGKVKPGQVVNIKFHGFPYMEYGMVKGYVKSISIVPAGKYYLVEVGMPDKLVTNYKKELPFSQEMQGQAEIITEDLSLLQRLINPIRAALMKN